MTKGNFFKYYNKLIGADAYMVFFLYDHILYMSIVPHLAPRWCKEERESTKNGGWQKWKMEMKKIHKEQLLRKGATAIMTEEEFYSIPVNNKGHKCEYYLYEKYNLGNYKPDNARFDKCGDVEIDGIRYQVKFENASLTNVNALHNAQRDARGL